jgi:mycothiol synthase
LHILKEAYFRSYRDMWGHGANRKTVDEVTPESMASLWLPDWDPEGESVFLAFGPEGVAGLCRATIGPKKNEPGGDKPVGFVDAPGVIPEHRRYELQRPLTLTVMHWLRARGHGALELWSYGDNPRTIDIYRNLGFTLFSHLIAYHLDLGSFNSP